MDDSKQKQRQQGPVSYFDNAIVNHLQYADEASLLCIKYITGGRIDIKDTNAYRVLPRETLSVDKSGEEADSLLEIGSDEMKSGAIVVSDYGDHLETFTVHSEVEARERGPKKFYRRMFTMDLSIAEQTVNDPEEVMLFPDTYVVFLEPCPDKARGERDGDCFVRHYRAKDRRGNIVLNYSYHIRYLDAGCVGTLFAPIYAAAVEKDEFQITGIINAVRDAVSYIANPMNVDYYCANITMGLQQRFKHLHEKLLLQTQRTPQDDEMLHVFNAYEDGSYITSEGDRKGSVIMDFMERVNANLQASFDASVAKAADEKARQMAGQLAEQMIAEKVKEAERQARILGDSRVFAAKKETAEKTRRSVSDCFALAMQGYSADKIARETGEDVQSNKPLMALIAMMSQNKGGKPGCRR